MLAFGCGLYFHGLFLISASFPAYWWMDLHGAVLCEVLSAAVPPQWPPPLALSCCSLRAQNVLLLFPLFLNRRLYRYRRSSAATARAAAAIMSPTPTASVRRAASAARRAATVVLVFRERRRWCAPTHLGRPVRHVCDPTRPTSRCCPCPKVESQVGVIW